MGDLSRREMLWGGKATFPEAMSTEHSKCQCLLKSPFALFPICLPPLHSGCMNKDECRSVGQVQWDGRIEMISWTQRSQTL